MLSSNFCLYWEDYPKFKVSVLVDERDAAQALRGRGRADIDAPGKISGKKSHFPVDKSGTVKYNNQAAVNWAADRGA